MPDDRRPVAFPTVGPAVHERAFRLVGYPLERSFRDWLGSFVGAGRVDEVMRAAASDPPLRLPALGDLTGREQQVLELVAEGCSNEEIAARLDVTLETVKTHVSRVLGKLGVRSRTAAARVLWEERAAA